MKTSILLLGLACAWGSLLAQPVHHEHGEFEATLHAPFAGQPRARTFTLSFSYPGLRAARLVDWRLELAAPGGKIVRRWRGTRRMHGAQAVRVRWDGEGAPPGLYQARMTASLRGGGPDDAVLQAWQFALGRPVAVRTPQLAAPPYTAYLGNLHSQTSHSDGGAEIGHCNGSQEPQAGRYGPADAYAYAHRRGLDILVASEHNHMYDGSDGGNPQADALKARALYKAGLDAAASYTSAHPGFLALYGLEWGVINKGGHVNIFNAPELLGWERNAAGELLADTLTPRHDYGALYALMKQRGWIGQFNHPSPKSQFPVDGVALAYTPDGDAAMALCEVVNSTAFSTNESETETRRSNFEMACNKVLEAGFHVAFSSNQDNHCANWGASWTNRTGVMIPHGTPLTQDSFIEALRARRVFATMDKGSTLVLTANGRMMGERFANSGPLTLAVHFASGAGKALASVAIMEGVPGRNGTVTQRSEQALTTFEPAPGAHFYYARVTQSDGSVLWSAPVWVTQLAR